MIVRRISLNSYDDNNSDMDIDSLFICHKLIRNMPKIKTKETWHVWVDCYGKDVDEKVVISDCSYTGIPFDFKKYEGSEYGDKVLMIFDALIAGLNRICDNGLPEIAPLVELCKKYRDPEVKNEYIYKKRKMTKNLFVEVIVDNKMHETEVFVVCKNKNKEIIRKEKLCTLSSSWHQFVYYLEKLCISPEKKEVTIPVDFDDNKTYKVSFADLIGDDKIIMPRKKKKKIITADTSFLEQDNCKAFWKTMDLCNWDKEGDDEQVLEPVVQHLSEQSDDVIFEFHDAMALLLRKLDTDDLRHVYKKHSGYFSEDDFLDSRCVALINGEEVYRQAIVGEFDYMWDHEFESLLYVPENAWARKHGAPIEDYPHETDIF